MVGPEATCLGTFRCGIGLVFSARCAWFGALWLNLQGTICGSSVSARSCSSPWQSEPACGAAQPAKTKPAVETVFLAPTELPVQGSRKTSSDSARSWLAASPLSFPGHAAFFPCGHFFGGRFRRRQDSGYPSGPRTCCCPAKSLPGRQYRADPAGESLVCAQAVFVEMCGNPG